MGTTAAVIAAVSSAVIGAGASIYSSNQAADAQEKAERERMAAEQTAQRERDRIAAEAMPDGEIAEGIEFGTSDAAKKPQSTTDFMIKSNATGKSGVQTTGGSGLGFSV